jgi:2-methylisocitrate lyase-like PEP mutase family enzyme
MTRFQDFLNLHHGPAPLLLPNAWDAGSAALLQQAGATAIATSSAALAWSLGYADGSALPRDELRAVVRRILRVVSVPVTMDIEDGYSSDPAQAAALIAELAAMGIAGINLEDGTDPPELLEGKIAAARQALGDTPLYINARTDVYLRRMAEGDAALAMTVDRLQRYHAAGASGAFVPGLLDPAPVVRIVANVHMPLNLMLGGASPPMQPLVAAGARRFSIGPALYLACHSQAVLIAQQFLQQGSTAGLAGHALNYAGVNPLFA